MDNGVTATLEHIWQVQHFLSDFAGQLTERGIEHDASKLREPELTAFAKANKMLSQHEYGSEGYHKARIEGLGPALTHHYQNNRHHPEHHQNGVNDMTLVDLVEMWCDWRAAVLRQKNGDLIKSIDINEQRFGLSAQLAQILRNTAKLSD